MIDTVYSILKKKLKKTCAVHRLKFKKNFFGGVFLFDNIFQKIPRFKISDHSLGTKTGRYTLDTLSIICLPFGILVLTEPIHL